MKTKSMMWAAAPLLLAITATAATAAEFTTLASAGPALEADVYDAVSESVLWSFAGSPDDGAEPKGSLIADQRGNLYGATEGGGASSLCTGGCGTVFEVSPPYGNSTQWSERVLYSFGATSDDGQTPGYTAGLIADKSGNLYGTTEGGGANGDGTVFELSPPHGKSTQWSERVLYSFGAISEDGVGPQASLLADKSGNLYGTTAAGGTNFCESQGCGTAFELSPPYGKSTQWSEQVLWNFAGGPNDGSGPFASLIADQRGNLYGTTSAGGASSFCGVEGCGTVFELSPPYGKSTQWSERVLYNFGANLEDGAVPTAGLLTDQRGNLYGTTETSISIGAGIAFELSPPYGKSAQWSEQVLWHFGAVSGDGLSLVGNLIADKLGNLYSTTQVGGANGSGTVFELSPPYGRSSSWSERVLYSFAGGPDDGAFPFGGLLADQWGNLYGTTAGGGADGLGIVFELSLSY